MIPELGRSPGGGHGNPLQYSRQKNPHGQRSLVGYSPWGCKESDTTEQLSTWDFPGGTVIKNLCCNARDVGLIPGQGTKIPHVMEQLAHAWQLEPNSAK